METLRLEGEPSVTKWEDLKTLIKSQFYHIGDVEEKWIQWNYFKKKPGQSVQEYTTKFRKMAIILGIPPKNVDVLIKYFGDLHRHLREKVMFFMPKSVDKAFIQTQYLENLGIKRVKSSGSKQKEKHEASEEGKKKKIWGKDKKMVSTTHHCKYPNNHCNVYGYVKEKCQKLHLELIPKNKKKHNNKKNIMTTNLRN